MILRKFVCLADYHVFDSNTNGDGDVDDEVWLFISKWNEMKNVNAKMKQKLSNHY